MILSLASRPEPGNEATSAALDCDVGGSGSTPQGEVNVLLVSDAPLSSFPSAPVRDSVFVPMTSFSPMR